MDSKFKNASILFAVLGLLLLLQGCGVYSFTGASISPDTKTISIQQFQNNAPLVQPRLSQLFTDALRDKFTSKTALSLVPRAGDLSIEGAITDYRTMPVAITGNEIAALNRLTISVRVTFTNRLDSKQNFETTFSRFEDYDSNMPLSSVEESLIAQINEALVQDIFNRAVVNW
ncbi:MAG TPA: LptE family protein [Bacteroidales bacterium]|nr:LptE family protein [Bacteroidales bacterium]